MPALQLAQAAEAAKAAADVLHAEDILAMTRACLVLAAAGVVFFFWKWQAEVTKSREEDAKQIAALLAAKGPGVQDWPGGAKEK